MLRQRNLLVLLVVLAIVVFLPAGNAAGKRRSSSTSDVVTRRYLFRLTDFKFLDVDGNGSNSDAGDGLIYRQEVLTADGSSRRGVSHAQCTVHYDYKRACLAQVTLSDGQLEVHGEAPLIGIPLTEAPVLAITGGTGRYRFARGTIKIAAGNDAVNSLHVLRVRL